MLLLLLTRMAGMLRWLSRTRTLHVTLRRRSIGRNHGTRLTAWRGTHSIVGVRVGTTGWHVGVMVIPRILLMLHRRLTVHLVLVMLWMLLVHRMMLGVMMHVIFVVGVGVRRTGITSRRHVMSGRFVRMHPGGIFRTGMRRMWRTGGRRRCWSWTTVASGSTGRRRFRFLATHYWATLRILSTLLSIGTIM